MYKEKSLSPHPVDVYVGKRLRERRETLNMSQEKLATSVGISCQQIQKYERAANRISASRLYDISIALDISIYWFFEGADGFSVSTNDHGGSPPPLRWNRLWHRLSNLPPEVLNSYIAFGQKLSKQCDDDR